GPSTAKSVTRGATEVLAFRKYAESELGEIVRPSVRMTRSKAASTAKGFMTTTNAVSPEPVVSSSMNQVRRGAASQRLAAIPAGEGDRTTAAAPTHPPKYSRTVASEGSWPETGR